MYGGLRWNTELFRNTVQNNPVYVYMHRTATVHTHTEGLYSSYLNTVENRCCTQEYGHPLFIVSEYRKTVFIVSEYGWKYFPYTRIRTTFIYRIWIQKTVFITSEYGLEYFPYTRIRTLVSEYVYRNICTRRKRKEGKEYFSK